MRWVVLDEQRELRFADRHAVLASPVGTQHAPTRAWRLRIKSVANPTAANSVQIASWDLFAEGSTAKEQKAVPTAAAGQQAPAPTQEAGSQLQQNGQAAASNPWAVLFDGAEQV